MLSILGGCTTRDIFRISKRDSLVSNLWARMAAPTIMAEPVYSLLYQPEYLPSNFEERQSFTDVNKLFFSEYKNARPKVLLVDFMSEVYDIGASKGGLVTMAPVTKQRKLDLGIEMRTISAFGDERLSMMRQSVPKLFRRLREEFGTKIIVHRIYQAERIVNDGGVIASFEDGQVRQIRASNRHLESIYNAIESEFADIAFFQGDANMLLADATHMWGVSPFHLISDYSISALKGLGERLNLDL